MATSCGRWIAALLVAYRDYHQLFDELYYWAPAEARETEVDFLLWRDKEFVALEIKTGDRVHDRHLKGLRAVAELPGLRRRAVVYPGARRMRTADGIEIWPLAQFLQVLQTGDLWRDSGV